MITAIVGLPGAGKSSFLTFLIQYYLLNEGYTRLNECKAKIAKFNQGRKKPLSVPEQPPIYSNFNVTIPIGYKKTFSPYWINPYYFGMPKYGKKIQPIAPYGVICFDEIDEPYDSRKKSLSEAVAAIYNKHRHFGLDIFFVLHRYMNVDTKIRSNINYLIEIMKTETEKNGLDVVVKTSWHLRIFEGETAYRLFLDTKGKEKNYKTVTCSYDGDIFSIYDSFDCAAELVPDENDDFSLLPQRDNVDLKSLPPDVAELYRLTEPSDFRGDQNNEN